MKLFHLVLKNFATLGIHSIQSIQNDSSQFNHKILLSFLLLASTCISISMYILREANSVFEYAQCVCSIFVGISMIMCLATFVFQMSKIIAFYDFAEKTVLDGEKIHLQFNQFLIITF